MKFHIFDKQVKRVSFEAVRFYQKVEDYTYVSYEKICPIIKIDNQKLRICTDVLGYPILVSNCPSKYVDILKGYSDRNKDYFHSIKQRKTPIIPYEYFQKETIMAQPQGAIAYFDEVKIPTEYGFKLKPNTGRRVVERYKNGLKIEEKHFEKEIRLVAFDTQSQTTQVLTEPLFEDNLYPKFLEEYLQVVKFVSGSKKLIIRDDKELKYAFPYGTLVNFSQVAIFKAINPLDVLYPGNIELKIISLVGLRYRNEKQQISLGLQNLGC